MKDELWIKKIKEQLENYSEPLPKAGWERLEKDLSLSSSAPNHKRRAIAFRSWAASAAAVVLIVASSISLWFALSPANNEMVPLPSSAPTATTPEPAFHLEREESPAPRQPLLAQHRSAAIANKPANEIIPSPISNLPAVEEEDDTPTTAPKKEAYEEKSTEKRRTTNKKRLSAPIGSKKNKRKASWAVGLSVGNANNMALNDATQGRLKQNSPVLNYLGYGGKIDLASTADGILTIPEGTNVVFKEGIPYLQHSSKPIASIDHQQPISVGLSVRKQLSNRFSVETGLTYTHLASDIIYENSPEKISQKLHYIGIPMRANWNFVDKKPFTMYVAAGGTVEKCVYGKTGHDNVTVNPLQLSVMGAIGAQVNLSKRIGIYVEPGISYFFDDGSSIPTIRKENPCNFTLQGGIRLTY